MEKIGMVPNPTKGAAIYIVYCTSFFLFLVLLVVEQHQPRARMSG